jgi:hypothetical protein
MRRDSRCCPKNNKTTTIKDIEATVYDALVKK